MKNPLGRGKQQHTMKTATTMVTRPMNLGGSEIDYAERSGAAFLPTFESHVLVPLAEAIISGFLVGMAAGVIVLVLWIYGNGGWLEALKYGFFVSLVVGFVVTCFSWRGHLGDYKSLLWYKEFAQGPEVEQQNTQVYKAEVKTNSNWVHADLPFDRDNPQALVDFAKGVIAGAAPFSERGAGRYRYSVIMFTKLRDNFIRGRMAYWKDSNNKRLGVGLSASGLALLKSVASNPPPANYEPSEDWGMSRETIQK